MPRKSPRDPEQALKLARFFREKYLSPEARDFADREMQRLRTEAARKAESAPPVQPFADLVARAGVDVPETGGAFSDAEKQRARQVLDAIRARYGNGMVH